MKHAKKILTVILASALTLSLASCGSSAGESESAGADTSADESAETASSADEITITFFVNKDDILEQIQDAMAAYEEEYGVKIVADCPSTAVTSYLSTRYATGNPYTIAMVNPSDVHGIGAEYGLDLSNQDWASETEYALYEDDKLIGFPFCIEGRGIIYNADAIEETTGEIFDPSDINYLEDFITLLDELVSDGMEYPTVVQKADWSLGYHFFQHVYEERDDTDEFIQDLYNGDVNLEDDEKFNSLIDTFDILMDYNYFIESPIKASDTEVLQAIAGGETAFKFGGTWEWADYITYDEYTENMGLIPIPQDVEDDYTGKLVGGVTQYIIVDGSEYTTDEQREAALDFLNWLVYSDEGQSFVTETCSLVSPFQNNTLVSSNPLANDVKVYADAGNLIPTFDYAPDDHQNIVGGIMQDYLAGNISREELAREVEEYWVSATPLVYW
ncbi:MAG: ABC transporter substrate-binding protein [Lachnospiraceae bacterium]|nr:ABC transporter substrate-binding protein [Lachnospiraceae bacterium]